CAGPALHDGLDLVEPEHSCEFAGRFVETQQTIQPADPEPAFHVFAEAFDIQILLKLSLLVRKMSNLCQRVAQNSEQSALSPCPHTAGAAGAQGVNAHAFVIAVLRESLPHAVPKPEHAVTAAHPKAALQVLGQRQAAIEGEGGRVVRVEQDEVASIKARQAAVGADPEKAIARLQQAGDRVPRHTVVS